MRRTSALAILAIIFVTWFAWAGEADDHVFDRSIWLTVCIAELLEENIEILTF